MFLCCALPPVLHVHVNVFHTYGFTAFALLCARVWFMALSHQSSNFFWGKNKTGGSSQLRTCACYAIKCASQLSFYANCYVVSQRVFYRRICNSLWCLRFAFRTSVWAKSIIYVFLCTTFVRQYIRSNEVCIPQKYDVAFAPGCLNTSCRDNAFCAVKTK